MTIDTKLDSLDPTFIDRVHAMDKAYDQFVELVDTLIDRNSRFPHRLAGNKSQRAVATLAALDIQVQNGGVMQFFWNCPELAGHVSPALRRIGHDELTRHFDTAAEQLAGNSERFIELCESGQLADFMSAAEENDFEWFNDLYFGDFDRITGRWSGLVEPMYSRSVSFILDHLGDFVADRPTTAGDTA